MDLSSSSSHRTEASCRTEAERLATSSSRAARGPEAASWGQVLIVDIVIKSFTVKKSSSQVIIVVKKAPHFFINVI